MKKTSIITAVAVVGIGFVALPTFAAVKQSASDTFTTVFSTPLTRSVTVPRTVGSKTVGTVTQNQTDGYVYKTKDAENGATCYVFVSNVGGVAGGISCVK